jgi:predicted HAD superfamily Cof-like phosphohydrolase
MSYTPLADVKKFHDTFAPQQREEELLSKTERRINLICEEYEEVAQAILYLEDTRLNMTSGTIEEAREELAKELADLLYVVYGTADELGIPLQQVFTEVHKSNMSKVWPDGTVKRNDFGKVLKPPTYKKPDLSFIHDNRVL